MSTSHDPTNEAKPKLKHPDALQIYRQPGGAFGFIEPPTNIDIAKLIAILGPTIPSDDPRVTTLLSVRLHWGIVHFVNDVIAQTHGQRDRKRKFLKQVIADPETALAG